MSYAMASATGIVFFQHILGVWLPVTLFTTLDGFVLVRVTFDAEKGSVFRVSIVEHILGLAVTVCANCIWCVGWIGNFKRFVRRVTGDTFVKCSSYVDYVTCPRDLAQVRFVAFKAIRFVAMFCMVAGRTI